MNIRLEHQPPWGCTFIGLSRRRFDIDEERLHLADGPDVLIEGVPGLVWAPRGQPRVAFAFTLKEGSIVAIDLVADPARLSEDRVVIEV